jgi:hypothetical protein
LSIAVGWQLVSGLVGSVVVVVALVGGQKPARVDCVEDQQVVAELVAEGLDESFAVRIHPWGPGRGLEDVDLFGVKDGIERGGVLAISVA